LNSIYDPDYTGSGGLAGGYTEWAYFYANYRVVKVDWKVEMTGSGNGSNGLLTVVPTNVSTSLSGSSAAEIEAGNLRYAKTVQQGAGGPVVRITGSAALHKLFGVTEEAVLGDNNYQSGFGNNPAFQYYLHILVNDQANASGVLDIYVELTYWVRLETAIASAFVTQPQLDRMVGRRPTLIHDQSRQAVNVPPETTACGSGPQKRGPEPPRLLTDAVAAVPTSRPIARIPPDFTQLFGESDEAYAVRMRTVLMQLRQ